MSLCGPNSGQAGVGHSFDRCVEAEAIHGINHLLDGDLGGFEHDDRLSRSKAHVCPTHTLQPFQGLLDRDGSAASRHPFDREDGGRRRRQGGVRDQREAEEKGQERRRAAHRIPPTACPV